MVVLIAGDSTIVTGVPSVSHGKGGAGEIVFVQGCSTQMLDTIRFMTGSESLQILNVGVALWSRPALRRPMSRTLQ